MQFVTEETGIDAHKLINGRKRSIAVDRLGLPWSLAVTSANTSDNEAGRLVIDRIKWQSSPFEVDCRRSGVQSEFHRARRSGWLSNGNCTGTPGQKPESSQGFVPQKNRWPVERSFGCGSPPGLNFRPVRRCGRLFRDVEKTVESSEAMLRIAFISFIINRL